MQNHEKQVFDFFSNLRQTKSLQENLLSTEPSDEELIEYIRNWTLLPGKSLDQNATLAQRKLLLDVLEDKGLTGTSPTANTLVGAWIANNAVKFRQLWNNVHNIQ